MKIMDYYYSASVMRQPPTSTLGTSLLSSHKSDRCDADGTTTTGLL